MRIALLVLIVATLAFGVVGCDDVDGTPTVISTADIKPTRTLTTSDAPLPPSAKGWEIYSWPVEDDWHFTLIAGTNRVKGLHEIYWDDVESYTDNEFRIKANSVESIKKVLERLPEGEYVFWLEGSLPSVEQDDKPDFSRPVDEIVEEIYLYCQNLGLEAMFWD